jgi:ubiquinone/menaquinone biosynthesis C-methylase UbiE
VTDRIVDRGYLTGVQYASEANLAARQAIYRYRQPPARTAPWALDLATMRGDERLLDIGCGNGLYLAELEGRRHAGATFGIDLSAGMLDAARSRSNAAVLVGDAQALPFAGGSFDRVLAMHMLYHVPNRDLAVAEIARVLAPGGTALVLTNSVHHLEELNALFDAVSGDGPSVRAYLRFSAELGASELECHFASVDRHDARAELVVTDEQAVVAYAASGWTLADTRDGARAQLLAEIERRTRERIAVDGAFRIRVEVACFVCRTRSGTGSERPKRNS